jgi:hypothetical protein
VGGDGASGAGAGMLHAVRGERVGCAVAEALRRLLERVEMGKSWARVTRVRAFLSSAGTRLGTFRFVIPQSYHSPPPRHLVQNIQDISDAFFAHALLPLTVFAPSVTLQVEAVLSCEGAITAVTKEHFQRRTVRHLSKARAQRVVKDIVDGLCTVHVPLPKPSILTSLL